MTISAQSFQRIAELARRETAMVYDLGKEYLVEARLLPLARAAGFDDINSYVTRVMVDKVEQGKALDALTINETSWFRDNGPYQSFINDVLPSLLQQRATTRTIRIWSAACSSGQEPYSLAMLLDEHLPIGWRVEILATDVSPTMVERVRSGRYNQVEMNRGLPAALLVKHFSRVGTEWQISQKMRDVVTARELNLAMTFPPLPTFDVVFIRNVLIYFDPAVRREILARVHRVTAPDGYLLLGASETNLDLDGQWTHQPAGRVQWHRPASANMSTVLTGA